MARTLGSTTRRHPVQNARQRAWNAMRILKVFTVLQVEISAEINLDNLKKYVRALFRSGYLRQARAKQNGKGFGHIVWRLVSCTGPAAPIVRRDQTGVYDPNRDVFVPWVIPTELEKEPNHVCSDSAPVSPPTAEESDHARRSLA